jgi:hypothetical protein
VLPLEAVPMILASSTCPDCNAKACSGPERVAGTNGGRSEGIVMAFRHSAARCGNPF